MKPDSSRSFFSDPVVERKLLRLEAAQRLSKEGGKHRALKLSPERRSEIASKASKARWKTSKDIHAG